MKTCQYFLHKSIEMVFNKNGKRHLSISQHLKGIKNTIIFLLYNQSTGDNSPPPSAPVSPLRLFPPGLRALKDSGSGLRDTNLGYWHRGLGPGARAINMTNADGLGLTRGVSLSKTQYIWITGLDLDSRFKLSVQAQFRPISNNLIEAKEWLLCYLLYLS